MQTTRFARDIEKNFNFNFESTAFKLETKLLKRKLKKKKKTTMIMYTIDKEIPTPNAQFVNYCFFFNSRWTLNQSRR